MPYRSKRRARAGGAHASQPSVIASRSAKAETFGSWIRTAEYPSMCWRRQPRAESGRGKLVVKAYREARYRCLANSTGRPDWS